MTGALVHMTNANTVTVAGVCGIRDNTTLSTIISGVTMTGLDSTGEFFLMTPATSSSAANVGFSVPAGNAVAINLFTAFTATTATLTVYLLGFEV